MDHDSDAPIHRAEDRRRALGRAVREACHSITQAELGEAVGRPQSCVSVWERGAAELSADRIFQIEEVLGLDHGDLLAAGGYVDRAFRAPWWAEGRTGRQDGVAGERAVDFPQSAREWLVEHGPMVEAAALLRGQASGAEALKALLETTELRQLCFAWELWLHLHRKCEQNPLDVLLSTLGTRAVDRCQLALWGESAPCERDAARP